MDYNYNQKDNDLERFIENYLLDPVWVKKIIDNARERIDNEKADKHQTKQI